MFDNKYKKVLKMLDDHIAFAAGMHDTYLHLNDGIKRSDKEIRHDFLDRGGQWAKVDRYQAQVDALCELRRQMQKEIGSRKGLFLLFFLISRYFPFFRPNNHI